MSNQKKGFVLYFDAYSNTALLPAEQRGELFSALFQYAREICETPEEPIVAVDKYPKLESDARMAFCFIAGNIARDTEKWRQKRERYVKAAEERHAARAYPGDPKQAQGKPDDAWGYI